MTTQDQLLQVPVAPTFHVVEAEASAASEAMMTWQNAGLRVKVLRGRKMRVTPRLMDEVAAALQFPHYFGENWAALDECLSDMEWFLPSLGIVVVVRDADAVLADEPSEELEALVTAMRKASMAYAKPIEDGEWWDRPALPFHVVLQVAPELFDKATRRWTGAGAATAPLK